MRSETSARVILIAASIALVATGFATSGPSWIPLPEAHAPGIPALGTGDTVPVSFEANRGQFDRRASFRVRGPGYTAFFTERGPVWSLAAADGSGAALEMRLVGGREVEPRAEDRLRATTNYFIGDDQAGWRRGVPTFGRVLYPGVYPGIDLRFRSRPGNALEYVLRLDPGADPGRIALAFPGAEALRLSKAGDLIISTTAGPVRHAAPTLFQPSPEGRVPVEGRFVLRGSRVGFAVGPHDPTLPLAIDPATDLVHSTFLGGSGGEDGHAIAVDGSGNAYVTGTTTSTNFPKTPGAFDTSFNGSDDVFVAKINAVGGGGSDLVYSTFLGGTAYEYGFGVAVDGSGNAYVTGSTGSSAFPTTAGAYDTSYNGDGDAFVAKITPDGDGLAYSTLLGGSGYEESTGIAVDGSGKVAISGSTEDGTTDLPTTAGAYDTSHNGSDDAFVAKINPAGGGGSDLAYSSFLGGSGPEISKGIAVDGSGNVYLAGDTESSSFPTTAGAYNTTHNGGVGDAFVAKINPAGGGGSDLAYSSFLGGSGYDLGEGVAVNGSGNAYVTGGTTSTDLPTTSMAFDTSYSGGTYDAFLAKINPAGGGATDLAYSTFLGGSGTDFGRGIAVGGSGNPYLTGNTSSADFPTTSMAYDTSNEGTDDVYVARINPAGGGATDLAYSTFVGGSGGDYGRGIAVGGSGNAYLTGGTSSTTFPKTPGAFDTSYNGGTYDGFLIKLLGDRRPDAMIRKGSGAFAGDDTFNVNATAQTRSTKAKKGQTKTFTLEVVNDRTATDSYTITGPDATSKWSIKYFSGATNITTLVTTTGFVTSSLSGGSSEDITIEIKPKNAANVGNKKSVLVNVASVGDPNEQDSGKAKVTVRPG